MADWVIDSLVGFLKSPFWSYPLNSFIDHHCTVFDPGDENKFSYTDIHKEYQTMVENLLESFTSDLGITSDQFSDVCSQESAFGEENEVITRDLSEIRHIKKRKEVLHEMKFSPDGRHLAVGSNDNFVDVYAVGEGYKHVGTCSGSSSFITHLDWSADSRCVQTNSGASERLYFQMPSGRRMTAKEEIQAIHWASWTSVLGPEVHGVWPKYTQVNDINATDASFEHQSIVTADDFGLVKLFRFPCIKKGAKFRKYVGHSAHVTNVRFTADKHHVISVGGADNAVFQWRFLSGGVEGEEESVAGGAESDSEESDSDMSDVLSLDSDLEKEQEKSYDRTVYREDLKVLKEQLRSRDQQEGAGGPGIKASRSAAHGRKGEVPEDTLTLEFVHGYRGYDCRNNLHYLQSSEIVYHIAALGIVYDRGTHKQRFYAAHTDDILCLCVHPTHDYIATGQIGRDPAIHIWDAITMETMSILKGEHERGVCAVDFSGDGKKLVSVGLDNDHCIVVWDWRKGERLAVARGSKDKIFVVCCHPHNSNQLATVGVKHLKFWTQAGGGFTSKRGVFGRASRPVTMLCITYGTVDGQSYSGGADGRVYHWNGNTLRASVEAHKGPVFAVQRVEKGFVSGGKDGVVGLWDEGFQNRLKTYQLHSSALEGGGTLRSDLPPIRALALGQGRILVGTKNSEILEIEKTGPITLLIQGHMEGEAWGLGAHPNKPRCVTASDDKSVMVWDLEAHRMLSVLSLGKQARCVGYSHDGAAIAVGMKDGSFVVVDAESLEQLASFHHRTQELSDIKFSPNGKYLAVASHDNFVDIYNLLSKKRIGICKGASSYITHIDWDTRGKLLQVNTGDREVLYYEAPRGKQHFIGRDDAEELTWASWTCVLGAPCTGIWPAYTDVTDVNTACVSRDGHVICTGDDFGFVKLFKYPSYGKHAKCRQYVGHSAHVTNVRFTHDDRKMVSLGGADMSVMVWAHSAGSREPSVVTDQSEVITSSGYLSEDSDTDSEEEGGYDSDVEREKKMDYISKIYSNPIREAGQGVKPHRQEERPQQAGTRGRPAVRRTAPLTPRVATSQRNVPVTDLSLEFIFGYRGFDTRQNLLLAPDGSVIYPAAGAGVVYEPLSKRQSFYLEHNDDIICVAINRNPKLNQVVATGQISKTAAIHVWDYHSKQTLSILQGAHGVGVCAVDFSCNGKLLLAVGLDERHSVTVWRWAEGSKVAQESGDRNRIFAAQFRPDSNTKFVTCGVKHVRFWSLAGTQLISKRGACPKALGAQMQTMLSLAFAPDDVTFTGSISGDVFVWKNNVLTRLVSQAHSGPVFAMFTCLEDGLIVSAGKERSKECQDAAVKLWGADMSRSRSFSLGPFSPTIVRAVCRGKGKILVGTQNNEVLEIEEKNSEVQVLVRGHGEGELWGLAAHPTTHTFVTASDDKTIRVWDIATKSLLHQQLLSQAARTADISPDGERMAVGLTNGEFLLLSVSDLSTLAHKRDRSKTIQTIRFSPDGSLLAVGSYDACVDIYSVSPSSALSRIGYCRGIPSFVTQLDWSLDGRFLQVSTGAYERLVYEAASGKQITSSAEAAKITWATWTSVLGEEVVGVWPKNADKADVNTAHLNNSGTALATGDDFGCLKLFDCFPITEKFAPHKKYYGHSAHVTNVRFTFDDQYLLSAGGDDSCIFVWKCQ